MKFYSNTRRMKILSFTSKWLELENIILSEVSQGQKASYADFKPKTNAVILDLGYTIRGEHMQEK
jgi:hypothetical protein